MTAPKVLGKYQIESLLGKGAFAEVYKAVDVTLKRSVALKVLKPALLADEEAFARFVQEAQTLANLVHPHIAWVWDLGEAEGRYFIAMRYVDGQSLDKVLAERGALPWNETLKITEQVAEALAFAHAQGLVHRDVKPQNIIISESEGAVLTDFGLVKALRSSGMSSTTSMIGTPSYIAPEIWEGEEVSPASDQYALACVVTEVLTGRVLFDGTTPAIMKKHLLEAPSLPEKALDEAPEGVLETLQRALDKRAQGRYAGMAEFVAGLKGPVKAFIVPAQSLQEQPTREEPPVRQAENQGESTSSLARVEEIRTAQEQPLAKSDKNQKVLTLAPGVEMIFMRVPAGSFQMGSNDGEKDERPQHTVILNEYWIGKTPVTNTQYKAFVKATGHMPPEHWDNSLIPMGKEDHPVVFVSWQDTIDFCAWISKVNGRCIRLPTEAEWEKAARGTDRRKYPWGNMKPHEELCNFDDNVNETTQVGRYSPQGDSLYGCSDMAGNVCEWTSSLWGMEENKPDYGYPYNAEDGREDIKHKGCRVHRGGSWDDDASDVRVAYRDWDSPDLTDNYLGFRCACSSNK